MGIVRNERGQFEAYLGLSLGTFALTIVAYLSYPNLFQRFLGRTNPLLVVLLATIVGGFFLAVGIRRGWFAVLTSASLGRFLIVLAVASLMALLMIATDLVRHFRSDINVAFPESILFYPVIAFVVEILFHVVPLTGLLFVLSGVFKGVTIKRLTWASMFVVALIEPAVQIGFGWPPVAVLQIFAFNLVELAFFKRFDFFTMYSFRLVYYVLWHILWGHIRLGLLF